MIWITLLNIFLSVLIFYHFFNKTDKILEALDNKCGKDKNNLVYKQQDKLVGINDKMKDVDLGIKLLERNLQENKKNIGKNKADLKAASQKIKNETEKKMKELG